jgi:hypothetical protein
VESRIHVFDTAALVIGFLSSLCSDDKAGLNVAARIYDALQRAVRHLQLSPLEEKFIKKRLQEGVYNWSLSSTIARAAVKKWPVGPDRLGVLQLTSDRQHFVELIVEIAAEGGLSEIKALQSNPHLSPDARESIRTFLAPTKLNPLLTWWW